MHEIEVKILEIHPQEIEQKLESLGAEKELSGEFMAEFYDFPDKSIRLKGDVFRLRQEGTEQVLTYKKFIAKQEAKIMEELETKFENRETMQKIIQALGLEVIKQTRKFRTQYKLADTHIVIDDYQDALGHIPPFLEIEAPDISRLEEVVQLLGFSMDDCKSWDTNDLQLHYSQQ